MHRFRGVRVVLGVLSGAVLAVGVAVPVGAATTHDVSIESFQFIPDDLAVVEGDTVRWTNLDGVAHNVSGGPLASGNFATGSYTYQFDTAGTYPYVCTLHSGMQGQVVVAAIPPPVVPEASSPPVLALSALVVALVSLWLLRRRPWFATSARTRIGGRL